MSACKLQPTPNPSVFAAAAGPVTITIVPTKGSVAFVPTFTTVTDDAGNNVTATITPTEITFTVVSGTNYHVKILYDIFPLDSTGNLQEQCSGGIVMDNISSVSNPQIYTIQG